MDVGSLPLAAWAQGPRCPSSKVTVILLLYPWHLGGTAPSMSEPLPPLGPEGACRSPVHSRGSRSCLTPKVFVTWRDVLFYLKLELGLSVSLFMESILSFEWKFNYRNFC